MTTWTLPVKEDESGECFIELPDEVIKQLNCDIGDVLEWTKSTDGAYILTKKIEKNDLYIVETITITKNCYAVRAKDPTHATDSVVMKEVCYFSTEYIDENIVAVRKCESEQDYLNFFNKPYITEQEKLSYIYNVDYKTES